MGPIQDHYDWIIIGDHPGALLTSVILSKLGASVLVVPLGYSRLATLSASGQYLDPEPNFLLGLQSPDKPAGILARFLEWAGMPVHSSKEFQFSEKAMPQIFSSQFRFHWRQSFEALEQEFKREFGVSVLDHLGLLDCLKNVQGPLLKFWDQFPAHLWSLERKDPFLNKFFGASDENQFTGLTRLLKKTISPQLSNLKRPAQRWGSLDHGLTDLFPNQSELQCLIEGLGLSLSGVEATHRSAWDYLNLLALAQSGASFKGGMTVYRQHLSRLAKKLGAHLPEGLECQKIFVERGRFVGIQLGQKGKMIGANAGIIGGSLEHVRPHMHASNMRELRHFKKAPPPVGWRFTLSLTVHMEAIPPGMNERAYWKQPGAPGLEIEVAVPSDYGLGQDTERLIFLRTCLPYEPRSLQHDYQALVAKRMVRQLTECLPFLEFHVVRMSPDLRGDRFEEQIKHLYGFSKLSEIPENLRCIEAEGVGISSGIRNLYVATGESYPSFGFFGPTLAGLESCIDFMKQIELKQNISMGGAHLFAPPASATSAPTA